MQNSFAFGLYKTFASSSSAAAPLQWVSAAAPPRPWASAAAPRHTRWRRDSGTCVRRGLRHRRHCSGRRRRWRESTTVTNVVGAALPPASAGVCLVPDPGWRKPSGIAIFCRKLNTRSTPLQSNICTQLHFNSNPAAGQSSWFQMLKFYKVYIYQVYTRHKSDEIDNLRQVDTRYNHDIQYFLRSGIYQVYTRSTTCYVIFQVYTWYIPGLRPMLSYVWYIPGIYHASGNSRKFKIAIFRAALQGRVCDACFASAAVALALAQYAADRVVLSQWLKQACLLLACGWFVACCHCPSYRLQPEGTPSVRLMYVPVAGFDASGGRQHAYCWRPEASPWWPAWAWACLSGYYWVAWNSPGQGWVAAATVTPSGQPPAAAAPSLMTTKTLSSQGGNHGSLGLGQGAAFRVPLIDSTVLSCYLSEVSGFQMTRRHAIMMPVSVCCCQISILISHQ